MPPSKKDCNENIGIPRFWYILVNIIVSKSNKLKTFVSAVALLENSYYYILKRSRVLSFSATDQKQLS